MISFCMDLILFKYSMVMDSVHDTVVLLKVVVTVIH